MLKEIVLASLLLPGSGTSASNWDLLAREVGRSIAHATLIAGPPKGFVDLTDGRRAFYWERSTLVPQGGPRCIYTLYATNTGEPRSLPAWRIVGIEPPFPECE